MQQGESKREAAQENGPGKLFMNKAQAQTTQAWIRQQTAYHQLCELNSDTDHC